MVCPKGGGLLHQAMPDAIFQYPDCPLYLSIDFAIANGNVCNLALNNSEEVLPNAFGGSIFTED